MKKLERKRKTILGPHSVTAVLSKFDTPDNLLIDEVGGDKVIIWVVPWCEDLLSEEQPPGGVPLLGSLLLCILLTLRDSIHHMVVATA